MSMSDPIADLLTRIRNAQMAKLPTVVMPSSKIKVAIAKVLQHEGYITGYSVTENDGKPTLDIELKYFQAKAVIEEIKRAGRPGLRSYKGKEDLPKVRAVVSISILCTTHNLSTLGRGKAAVL